MSIEPMSDDVFWTIIDRSRGSGGSHDEQLHGLRDQLSGLTVGEVVSFDVAFQCKLQLSYSWDLWGAAYIINGGASDDGFEYFRRGLILRGRKIFEGALNDPDNLADLLDPEVEGRVEFDEIAYVAAEVWAAKTSKDPYENDSEFLSGREMPAYDLSGEPFSESADHLSKRYPKVWKEFHRSTLSRLIRHFGRGLN